MEKLNVLISKATWAKLYAALPTRKSKASFRQQFKFYANIESDSMFRNMKNGYRKTPQDALKYANDFFQLSR